MVTDRKPQPLPSWTEVIAEKDAEIAALKEQIERLRAMLYDAERQVHLDMSR